MEILLLHKCVINVIGFVGQFLTILSLHQCLVFGSNLQIVVRNVCVLIARNWVLIATERKKMTDVSDIWSNHHHLPLWHFWSIDNTTVLVSQYLDTYHNICTFKLKSKGCEVNCPKCRILRMRMCIQNQSTSRFILQVKINLFPLKQKMKCQNWNHKF